MANDIPDSAIVSNAPHNFIGLINDPICISKRKATNEDKENQVPKSSSNIFIKPIGVPRSRSCSLSVKRDSPATKSPSPVKRKKRPRNVYRSKSFYDSNADDFFSSEKVIFEGEIKLNICCGLSSLVYKCLFLFQKFELPTPTRALQRSRSFDVKHSKSPSVDITKLFGKYS